ncbi:hypothetical protein CCE01nite_30200 [Cellulomonas cellasea]|uniref:Uncharacterized protein n=1 Tax=Cellulomonas cellasea TaxID=43670 RepID=A0A4Y3KX69_9CELL|nr:hypothetical protein CCE01nite_30200 [Cellulomonas cellasea]
MATATRSAGAMCWISNPSPCFWAINLTSAVRWRAGANPGGSLTLIRSMELVLAMPTLRLSARDHAQNIRSPRPRVCGGGSSARGQAIGTSTSTVFVAAPLTFAEPS